jgi:ABC-type transport system involved in multi-copper enzyme maturation permease subunit
VRGLNVAGRPSLPTPGAGAREATARPGRDPASDPATRTPDALRAIAAIARNTFREAVRDRVLYLLLFFGLFVFGASRVIAPLALGEGRRVTLDLGFAAISAFGCLTTIFVGHQLIFREIERKTLYFLFARPLRRSEFVLGKYAGLCLVLAAAVAVMGGMLALVLRAAGYALGPAYGPALLLAFFEMAVLAAVAVLCAAVSAPVLAGLFTLAGWIIGHAASDLRDAAALLPSPAVDALLRCLYWIVPRLDLYHDTLPILRGEAYPAIHLLWGAAYAAIYAAAALLGATLALRRREFPL